MVEEERQVDALLRSGIGLLQFNEELLDSIGLGKTASAMTASISMDVSTMLCRE